MQHENDMEEMEQDVAYRDAVVQIYGEHLVDRGAQGDCAVHVLIAGLHHVYTDLTVAGLRGVIADALVCM